MAQNEGDNPALVNGETERKTLVRALQENVESQTALIQELRLALQRLEREKEQRETTHNLEYQRCWYPYALLTEEERTQEMLGMLRPDIARAITENEELPTTMADCFGRALRVKHRLAQIQEKKAKGIKVGKQHGKRKDNPSTSGTTQFQGKKKKLAITPKCKECGRNHQGECKYGTNVCYKCGKEGHFARGCNSKCGEGSG